MVTQERVRIGTVALDPLTMDEALATIERLVLGGEGGVVFTANVDHVVVADRRTDFRAAYARADVVLCDGQLLAWASRLLGRAVEKVSGSDLFVPLMRRAAALGLRVYLLGAGPGVAEEGARRLARELGVTIAGWDDARIGYSASPDEDRVVDRIVAARPDLVAAFLGAPKSELWSDRTRARLRPAILISLGASLDFYVGSVRRAPPWMRSAGLEWLYRLLQEPRRLARRYLVDDPRFLAILARTLRERARQPRLPAGAGEAPRGRPDA